jgi:4,5-DOPA dioxygenase extradiol
MKFSSTNSSLFISHGAPDLLIRDTPAHNFLKTLGEKFEKPKAIVVFSAHYESDVIEITGNLKLDTIYDFGGFLPELYKISYPASGAPDLALKLSKIFNDLGFSTKINPKRGLDHGAWVPLKLMFPEADIPVIQISLQVNEDAIYHYKIGRIVAQLKEQNILIIGSGSVTHNLAMAFQNKEKPTPIWVEKFSEEINRSLANQDLAAIINWHDLEYAQENHPSFEHFIPLIIALGAAGANFKAQRLHHSFDYSVLAMDCYVFNEV